MTIPEHPAEGPIRRFIPEVQGFAWEGIPRQAYKPDGTPFREITRQVLFGEAEGLPAEGRYFEIAPGGYSSLERHRHVHAVLVLRGRGRVLVGDTVYEVGAFDLVHVPPLAWHQFRADRGEPLGFLCLVDCRRDPPVRPDAAAREALRALPGVGDFIRT
jgi:quercetin dioxygenase-like cupin family protein